MKLAHALLLAPFLVSAQSLTLQQGLQEALTKGPEAELIRVSVDSANETVKEVRKVAWPTVTGYANAGAGRQPSMLGPMGAAMQGIAGSIGSLDSRVDSLENINVPGSARDSKGPLAALSAMDADPDDATWSVGYGVQATQPLFTFGKVTTALRMASTQNRLTSLKVKTDRTRIQKEFITQWTMAVLASRRVATIERSIERQREMVAFLERNFSAGSGMKAQVLLARSQMLRLQPDLLAARRDAIATRSMLNRTLGRPSDDATPLDTTGLPELEALVPPSRQALLSQAMDKRNDLRTMKEFLGLQQDLITIYRANYLPNIFLNGKVGVISNHTEADEAFKGAGKVRDNYEWKAGVGMQWNLFDGFEQSAKAGQTKAAVHALQIRQNDLTRMVEVEVDQALLDRQAADSALAAATEALEGAVEARKLYGNSFRQGSGALSDILSAEENQRFAEFGLVSAQLERTRAAAMIALVRGQDLINLPEEP
jgi:outer membrane protein TolC